MAAFRFSATVMGKFQISRGTPKERVVFRNIPLTSNSFSLKGTFCISASSSVDDCFSFSAYGHNGMKPKFIAYSIYSARICRKIGANNRTLCTFLNCISLPLPIPFVSEIQIDLPVRSRDADRGFPASLRGENSRSRCPENADFSTLSAFLTHLRGFRA